MNAPPYIPTILLSLLWLTLMGCEEYPTDSPAPEPFKLTAVDRGGGNKNTYTYDARGRVTNLTSLVFNPGDSTASEYVYTLTRDDTGQLTKSVITHNGAPSGTETYTYTEGRITKVAYLEAHGTTEISTIDYNVFGQISAFIRTSSDSTRGGKDLFEYNNDGVMTKHSFANARDKVVSEVRIKPSGQVISPKQLLVKRGLPYDLRTGASWAVAEGGKGSSCEYFAVADSTGKLLLAKTIKTASVKTNVSGYLTEATFLPDTIAIDAHTYTVIDGN